MIRHKTSIVIRMALHASRNHVARFDLGIWRGKAMTRPTRDTSLAVIVLMVNQRKTKLIVRENIGRRAG